MTSNFMIDYIWDRQAEVKCVGSIA